MLRVTCSVRSGSTDDELGDDEGEDAAQQRESAQQHQRDRAAARQAPPVQPVHGRHQQRADHQGQQHRDDDDLEPRHHPQEGDDRGQDDQQTPRPGCRLADKGFDGSVVGVCRHPASLSGLGLRGHPQTLSRRGLWVSLHDPVTRATRSELRLDCGATCAVTLNHVSHDAPIRNLGFPRGETPRGKYWWVRWAVLGVVAIVLAVEVALGWDQLAKAWTSLFQANWWWLLAAVLAAAASMHSFAQIQRTLLRSAGVHVKQVRSEAAFYAANSLSTTLPGGPVLSATFLLRQQRIWGASTVVASWQLVMSGVLQAVGLALLGLGGAFFLGAKNNPFSLLFTLGGFIALLLLAQAVASRPELIEGIGTPRAVVGQLGSRQAGRHRPGEVARDPDAARVGQPGPTRLGGGVQLVDVQLDRRRGLPRLRRVRGRRPCVCRRADGGLRGRTRRRHDSADAGRVVGRRSGAGARPGVQRYVVAQRHLGHAALSADQLAAHLRCRLGGVLLHVPHRKHGRLRRRFTDRPAARLRASSAALERSRRE